MVPTASSGASSRFGPTSKIKTGSMAGRALGGETAGGVSFHTFHGLIGTLVKDGVTHAHAGLSGWWCATESSSWRIRRTP
ncbi:hypothetical protein ACFVQ4_32105 [Streptomyces laurentii]|uniref:hypothetical protein n=1 Tax=Streptomyces laurentii TaxID=39478 RepID=UPI00368C115A